MDFLLELQKIVEKKTELGKLRTATNYDAACRSLAGFLLLRNGHAALPMKEVTAQLMAEYEDYLLTVRKIQRNSSSAYMRTLRAGYNSLTPPERLRRRDPFAHVYTGIDHTVKRAIGVDVIRRLAGLDLTNRNLLLSRDLFLFSFYVRGIAFIDLVKLKKGNLVNGRLIYHRSKTGHLLSVKVEKNMLAIINKYTRKEDDYLFPILKTETFTPKAYWSALRMYNLHLKELSAKAGIHVKLTSYVARHSWATEAMRQHVPLRVISESMGHSNEKTTSIYLSSLDNREVDKATRKILDAVRKKIKGEKAGNKKDKKLPTNSYSINSVISFYYTSTQEVDNFDANVDKILKPTK